MKPLVIEPKRAASLNLGELWRYRELFWMLAYRDFRVRYAQTFLGVTWAVINPVITLVLLSFVFHRVAGVATAGVPPLLYTIAGLCGWTYFAEVFNSAGDSLLGAQNMVKKIYFPRLIIPLSKAVTALVDLGIVFLILAALMLYYGFLPGPSLLFLPFFVLMAILSGLAGGLWVSALTIRFRDFKYVAPLFVRIGLFITPIAYSAADVPEAYRFWYYLNPMAGVVEGMRWSLLGGQAPPLYSGLGFLLVALLFLGGLVYFQKIETLIADIL